MVCGGVHVCKHGQRVYVYYEMCTLGNYNGVHMRINGIHEYMYKCAKLIPHYLPATNIKTT